MKVGGQIPWNAILIFEMFKISYLMGRPTRETLWETTRRTDHPVCSPVEYYPISAKDQSRIHQFGKKVLPGLPFGHAQHAAGIWKGDTPVADIEELETMDASEIYSKRLNAKEVIFPKEKGNFIFPAADGRIKLPGRDQELRTSTLLRNVHFEERVT